MAKMGAPHGSVITEKAGWKTWLSIWGPEGLLTVCPRAGTVTCPVTGNAGQGPTSLQGAGGSTESNPDGRLHAGSLALGEAGPHREHAQRVS